MLSDDVCSMERDTGPCTDYRAVWYFEPVSRTCRRFLFGGCDGNGNKFNSSEECHSRCLDRQDVAMTTIATTTAPHDEIFSTSVLTTDDLKDDEPVEIFPEEESEGTDYLLMMGI